MTVPRSSDAAAGARAAVSSAVDGPAMLTPPERALPRCARRELDPDATMKIGEVADRLGLSLRSIRYYEEAGLVTPASRTSGGFRLYCELDVQRLLLIMQMKPLGFTLEQMRQVLQDLDDVDDAERPQNDRTPAARARLAVVSEDVDARYAALRQRLDIADMFRQHLRAELDPDGRSD